jgi:hypothetical protein
VPSSKKQRPHCKKNKINRNHVLCVRGSMSYVTYVHRYTVVGNPGGGGYLGFLANSFEGGEKISGGGVVFFGFLFWSFLKYL